MSVKNRVKPLRETSGLSQGLLAEKLGVSQQRISQFENQQANPNAEEIVKLLKIFGCSVEELLIETEGSDTSNNLFMTYIYNDEHVDPNFTKLTYGDSGPKGNMLKSLVVGDGAYIFFHTTINKLRYITAYFYVKQILIKGLNDDEIEELNVDASVDDVIVIGDRERSKILTTPLLFDKQLALELPSLNYSEEYFQNRGDNLKAISDKIRPHRPLSDSDVNHLLTKCEKRG